MTLIDPSIEARRFAPESIALAVRTIGACPVACHRPDNRILCGIGVLHVSPCQNGYRFSAGAVCRAEEDTTTRLLDWLEPQLARYDAIISWSNWGSVAHRLRAIADLERHPHIISAATDTACRWRDMPRGHTWHLRQAPAAHLPCLCPRGTRIGECDRATPTCLLPDPTLTAASLIREAIAGWQTWAQLVSNFAAPADPASAALRALEQWRNEQRPAV